MSNWETRPGDVGHLQIRHGEVLAGVPQRIAAAIGEPVVAFVSVIETVEGHGAVLYPPGQNPAITADLLDDAAHRMRCGGCEHCR